MNTRIPPVVVSLIVALNILHAQIPPSVEQRLSDGRGRMVFEGDPWPFADGHKYYKKDENGNFILDENGNKLPVPNGNPTYIPYYVYAYLVRKAELSTTGHPYTAGYYKVGDFENVYVPTEPDALIDFYINLVPWTENSRAWVDDEQDGDGGGGISSVVNGYHAVPPPWTGHYINIPEGNPPRIQEDQIKDPTMLCKIYLRFRNSLTTATQNAIEAEAANFLNTYSQIDPNMSAWKNFDPVNKPGFPPPNDPNMTVAEWHAKHDWRDNCNNAGKTTWYLTGSENHDMSSFKVGLLFSARVLCESTNPNYGPNYLVGRQGVPQAGDPPRYTARQHYDAWIDYFKRYMKDRAQEGINCEIDNPGGYGRMTIRSIYELYEDSETGSVALKELAGKLLDIYWARAAQEFHPSTSVRAGIGTNRLSDYLNYMMGGVWYRQLCYAYGWTDDPMEVSGEKFPNTKPTTSLTAMYASSYRPPAIVQAIARGGSMLPQPPASRPPFQATSRHFGWAVEDNKMNLILFDALGGYVRRDTYYTPDYGLSGLFFDQTQFPTDPPVTPIPQRYYTGSRQTRIAGVTFATSRADRIVIMGDKNGEGPLVDPGPEINPSFWKDVHDRYAKNSTLSAINCVVQGNALIAARDINAARTSNGGNFPDPGVSVFISAGTLLDNLVTEDNWIFTRAGNGYAGIRIFSGYSVYSYTKGTEGGELRGKFYRLDDKWAPVVIQMGQAEDFSDFADFKTKVKARQISNSDNTVTYYSLPTEPDDNPPYGNKLELTKNSAIPPEVNDVPVNVNPTNFANPAGYLYCSPYLNGAYGTDVMTVSYYPGYMSYPIDFSSVINDTFDNNKIPGGWTFTSSPVVDLITSADLTPPISCLQPEDVLMRVIKANSSTGAQYARTFATPHTTGKASVEWRFIHLEGKEFRFQVKSNQASNNVAVSLRIKDINGSTPGGLRVSAYTGGSYVDLLDTRTPDPTDLLTLDSNVPYKLRAVCNLATSPKTVSVYIDQSATPIYTGNFQNSVASNIAKLECYLDNASNNMTSKMVFDDLRVLKQD